MPWCKVYGGERDRGRVPNSTEGGVQGLPVLCIRCRFYSLHNYSKYHLILPCFRYLNYLGINHEC